MRQIITVSFDNTMLQLDEEAYTTLRRYLDRARAGLADNPDVNEIVGDLERSIAEKCSVVVQVGKQVLGTEDMSRILEQMGPVVEDGDGAADQPIQMDPNATVSAPRKLYKQPDGAKLSGVCTGLAEYFGIDAVFIRIGFIALSLLAGFGLLLYLVLEVLMPTREIGAKREFKALKIALFLGALMALYLWASAEQPTRFAMIRMSEFMFIPFALLMFVVPLLTAVAFVVLAIAAVKYVRSGSRAKN